jgi:hypothetical protein
MTNLDTSPINVAFNMPLWDVVNALYKDKGIPEPQLPNKVYHYTASESLIGIISKKEMWCTDFRHLNDTSEVRYAFDLIKEAVNSRISVTPRKGIKSVLEYLEKSIGLSVEELYIASFTELPDALSQWRGYCPPSGGYAIGFPTAQILGLQKNRLGFSKCVYDKHSQGKLIEAVLDIIIKSCDAFIPNDLDNEILDFSGGDDKNLLVAISINVLNSIAPLMKHESFEEEKEWRLIIAKQDIADTEFRPSSKGVIPYYKQSLVSSVSPNLAQNGQIKMSVMIGPAPDMSIRKHAVQALSDKYFPLINDHGSKAGSIIQIDTSSIPYKGW